MTTKRWRGGLLALMATTAVQADGALGHELSRMDTPGEPRSGILAVVGVGLLVLSVFARRRDP